MEVAAVLFDLDGTLLDTIEDLTDSMNAVLGEHGYPRRTVAECKQFVGDGVEQFMRRALPGGEADDARMADLIAVYRERYAGAWDRKTRPYPGVCQLLEELAAHRMPMAVLSNKPDATTRQAVGRFFPGVPFGEVRGARPTVPLKPDPTAAIAIAEGLGVAPRDMVLVGDTRTDMQTAGAAGMFPLGVLWGFRGRDELVAYGARQIADAPAEVLTFITRKTG